MTNLTWIIQKNLTSELDRWYAALAKTDSAYRDIEIVPFADDLPDVEIATKHAVAHGSTTMIRNAHKKGWTTFFDPENFRPSLWCQAYGRHFLNWNNNGFMMLKDVQIPEGELRFMRPNGDFKDFSGSVVDKAGVEKFQKSVREGGYPFTDELIVCVAPIRNLFEEYRTFIVDGSVVSASKYRLRTVLDKKPGAPHDILFFAQKMASIWSPEDAYTMDICRTDEGAIHLLELNCFNASGVYKAPLEPVIEAIEKLKRFK